MSSNHSAMIQMIRSMMGQANILTIPRILIDFTGSLEGALLLSQIIYWSDRGQGGWFFKTYDQWEEELSLTRRQLSPLVKKFEEQHLIQTDLRKANGAPTVHYRFDYDVLEGLLVLFFEQKKEDAQNAIVQNVQMEPYKMYESNRTKCTNPITETTTEINSSRPKGCDSTDRVDSKNDKHQKEQIVATGDKGFALSEKNVEPTPSEVFASNVAKHLYEAIAAKGKIMRPPNMNKWRYSMLCFVEEHWEDRDRIKRVLKWYCEHLGENGFIPKAYSADAFIDKFVAIEDAMTSNGYTKTRQEIEDDRRMEVSRRQDEDRAKQKKQPVVAWTQEEHDRYAEENDL